MSGAKTGFEVAGITDQGPVRQENQDVWEVAMLPPDGCLLLVADGMGGHADGGTSARVALAAARRTVLGASDPAEALHGAFLAATAAVAEHRHEIAAATGTTLVIAVVRGTTCRLGNVGDSRAYHVRDGRAQQLTQDHSLVAEEVRAGRLPWAAGDGHPNRNVLTRAVTGDPVQPDVFDDVELAEGDVVLLCSDGFWEVEGARVGEFFREARPLRDQVAAACHAALEAGARDNVTVVALRVPPAG